MSEQGLQLKSYQQSAGASGQQHCGLQVIGRNFSINELSRCHRLIRFMNSTSTPTTENVNRLATIAMSVVYLLGGLFFGWNLLVIYAFSTMVDPALPDQQQHQEIVRRFLFGDGIHQIIFVIGLFAAALICFALSAMNVWSAVTGTRTKTKKSVISTGAITLSLIVFGIIYFAFS